MKSSAEIILVPKGENLTENGEYIIIEGYVSCRVSGHVLRFFKKGDRLIRRDSILIEGLTYRAQKNVQLLKLDEEIETSTVIERYLQFEKRMVQLLVGRLDKLHLKKKEFLLQTLYDMGREVGIVENNTCRIPYVWSQMELAQHIDCTREYLLAQKKELQQEGYLADSRHWVLIHWDGTC